jgi:hypothetical protein
MAAFKIFALELIKQSWIDRRGRKMCRKDAPHMLNVLTFAHFIQNVLWRGMKLVVNAIQDLLAEIVFLSAQSALVLMPEFVVLIAISRKVISVTAIARSIQANIVKMWHNSHAQEGGGVKKVAVHVNVMSSVAIIRIVTNKMVNVDVETIIISLLMRPLVYHAIVIP